MLQTDVVCIYEQFMYDCVNQKDMILWSVAFKKASLLIISLTSKTLEIQDSTAQLGKTGALRNSSIVIIVILGNSLVSQQTSFLTSLKDSFLS